MARTASWNPIAFVQTQVTLISSAVYIALFVSLLWTHLTVPSAPSDPTPVAGVNLTQAWLDLDVITDGFHPYDSRRNDVVRAYLVARVEEILAGNGIDYKVVGGSGNSSSGGKIVMQAKKHKVPEVDDPKPVTLFTHDQSNVTFAERWRNEPWTCYGESQNILVYIRGKEDAEAPDWWTPGHKYEGKAGGVLVNAHYDSVSTGYGATDDGMGVVTVLQLISHFTTEGNQPQKGIVALLNDGEENGLYGAHNYIRHPLSQFAHTFLNLEGAGAGGRATLFRSTDAQVTKAYAQSPNPFGSVTSGDAFKRGVIRSGTDYSVLTQDLGMRGLDVAFYDRRASYHTENDDSRDASIDSLWHMLSASLATMHSLTSSDSGSEFDGSTAQNGRLNLKAGSDGVWWDMFGITFAVMQLPTLFALSVTLLTAGPLILIVLEVIIARNDKWYPLSRKSYAPSSLADDEPVLLSGVRGFFRFPIAFILATAAVVALAYLLAKINPYIAYSSEFVVWAMLLSAWFGIMWFVLAGADRVRPTALQRMFCLIWLYALTWIALVGATVGENNLGLASGYFVVIYHATVFVALLISYLELFGLPTKGTYAEHVIGASEEVDRSSTRPGSRSSRTLLSPSRERSGGSTQGAEDDDDATERTSLIQGGRRSQSRGTFAKATNNKRSGQNPEDNASLLEDSEDPFLSKAYGDEQPWSSSLLQWTWIVQFLVLAPINIILVGQIALLTTTALHQTPADGSSVLTMYLIVAALAVLLLLPLTPFLHRVTFHWPTALFFVFIGCLLYNMLAFPFGPEAKLKVYFTQQIELDTGRTNVSLTGLDGYVQDIIAELPSAGGRALDCGNISWAARPGLQSCVWEGLAPNVVPEGNELAKQFAAHPYSNRTKKHSPEEKYKTWMDFNASITSNHSATFSIQGRETKQCRLVFDAPISNIHIADASVDTRSKPVPEQGSSQVRLFSRTWDKRFEVNVTWSKEAGRAKGQKGKVMCMWSDANQWGTIPALDEVRRFAPVWSVVSKGGDGLVEGWKAFELK